MPVSINLSIVPNCSLSGLSIAKVASCSSLILASRKLSGVVDRTVVDTLLHGVTDVID